MPTYIFKNKKTDEIFEQQMRISELDEYTGWYETDFKTGNKKNIAKSDNESQSSQKPKEKKDSSTKKVSSEKK